jgi:UDP-2-acetamido-3-amino-2,3-dideoxy-glucuronate N-acetyltransferase
MSIALACTSRDAAARGSGEVMTGVKAPTAYAGGRDGILAPHLVVTYPATHNFATDARGTTIWNDAVIDPSSKIGSGCFIAQGVYIDQGVEIGDHATILNWSTIYGQCRIESFVFVGPHVSFTSSRYPRAAAPVATGVRELPIERDPVVSVVEQGASVGAGAVILPGYRIGRYAMVGAGAVITRDVPDQGLVVGNPARLIGYVCTCGSRLIVRGDEATCVACKRAQPAPDTLYQRETTTATAPRLR